VHVSDLLALPAKGAAANKVSPIFAPMLQPGTEDRPPRQAGGLHTADGVIGRFKCNRLDLKKDISRRRWDWSGHIYVYEEP
jgi:hypothetical protein